VFVPGKPFWPSLIFGSKSREYSNTLSPLYIRHWPYLKTSRRPGRDIKISLSGPFISIKGKV
jgi:hypothetical protein